jgi:hypothetical protein
MFPVLKRSMEAGSSLSTKEIEDWKTFGSFFATYAKATGLDKPQQAVQVNVWGDGWGAQGAVPVEGESVEDGE